MGLSLISCGAAFTTVPDSPNVKTRYYNNQNRYTDYSIETPYSIRYYDKNGKFIGRSISK